jgi:hypothetical protein
VACYRIVMDDLSDSIDNALLYSSRPPPGVPFAAFRRCLDYLNRLRRLLEVCRFGIRCVHAMPDVVAKDIIPALRPGPEDVAVLKKSSRLAAEELDKGFPFLNSYGVVACWGALEALATDVVIDRLLLYPDTLSSEPWAKLKVTFADYERLDRVDKLHYATRELERSVSADLKAGVNRFEAMFAAIGVDGPVDAEVRRSLFEMSQVRNLIVHRASIADAKFITACPWFKFKIGDEVLVTDDMCGSYLTAAYKYVILVMRREKAFYFERRHHTVAAGHNISNTDEPKPPSATR